ncbi:TetR/AcrR family transcriptional regulator [Cellulomonas rhizosphaerae]|uniref:TetR family transcriptional regulator n=1 Tax=Cellulomonas rhizosphaerae TaxID=2293719 RepID=A0A413RLN3_9CELL|nr:TetR family transcriptional regulator [Cellulomonas rhizosphaerae]RHA40961.1 TetR family transcriptional regulator [Cellulomonas rhizosphaerae]
MNRMPVAERREQLVEAALAVASRDGIEAATVRAVAAEAGVSLGVVHYCFQDKDELLRAMAHAITERNAVQGLDQIPAGLPVETVLEAAIGALWASITGTRGSQLLSYELTTSSLRHPELNQVAAEQYRGQWTTAQQVLEVVGRAGNVRWLVPTEELARVVVAVVDGYSLAWLVDDNAEAALRGLQGFGTYLATLTVPVEGLSDDAVLPVPAGA